MVSADKRFKPILAFGDAEEWGSEDMGGVDVWVHCTKEEIKKNMQNFEEPPKHVQVQWDNYIEKDCDPVDPDPDDPDGPNNPPDPPTDPCPPNEQWWQTGRYVSAVARWNQGGIYKFFSPSDNDCLCDKEAAGCGPIAMAMIMRYYESPTGTICWGSQGTTNCVTLNSFEYSIMPVARSTWCGTPTGGDRNASILIRVCGHNSNSDYGVFWTCNTATYSWNIPDAFETMGYSSGGDWGGFSEKNVETRSELRNFHPVLFSGTLNLLNLNDYHTWVGDGLQTKTYSYMGYDPYDYENNGDGGDGDCYTTTSYYYGMNWGQGGRSNGYYIANGSFPYNGSNGTDTYDTYIKTLTNIRP